MANWGFFPKSYDLNLPLGKLKILLQTLPNVGANLHIYQLMGLLRFVLLEKKNFISRRKGVLMKQFGNKGW